MAKTGLLGPYRLTFDEISEAVTLKRPGAFALGYHDRQGRFCIRHVGRSDTDVRGKLCEFIGSDNLFKYTFLPSSQDAFEKECGLYHDFSPPGNRVHPARPTGTNLRCPFCSIFDEE